MSVSNMGTVYGIKRYDLTVK